MVDIIWPLVCDNSRNFLGFLTKKKCQVPFLSEWMLRYTPLKTVLGHPKEIYVNQPSWLRGAISVKLQGVYGISYPYHPWDGYIYLHLPYKYNMTWMLRYVKSPVLQAFVDALHHGFHSLRSVSSRLRLEFTDLQDFDFTLLKQAQPFETRFEIGTAG